MRPTAGRNQHTQAGRSCLYTVAVACALLWCAANVGVGVGAVPDYPTFAAAMQDQKNSLGTMYVLLASPTLVKFSTFLNDPNNNAILLALTNSDLEYAFTNFTDIKSLLSDSVKARAMFLFLVIPQAPGTRNAELSLTDGITLNTNLTTSTEYAQAIKQTLSTLTFRSEGSGKWYVGGTPPGALLDLSKTFTCGAGRIYILDAGFLAPPSKVISTSQSVDLLLSVVEALQSGIIPRSLTTYAELALADSSIKAMFSNPDLTITIFAPHNQAWSDYLASKATTLEAFKGSKQAQDVLLGCMAVQRPYMISQFPAGLTQIADSLNRTFHLSSAEGTPLDNSTQAKLVTAASSMFILPAPARNLRGGKSIIHGIDGVLIPDMAAAVANSSSGAGNASAPDYPTFAAAFQDAKNSLTSMYVVLSSPTLVNATAFLNDPNNNAVLLAVTDSDVQSAFSEFTDSQQLVSNGTKARTIFLYMVIPQAPGTRNAELKLTDGITLNTSLTYSPEYSKDITQTVSTITFRSEGQGKWYLGGVPPGGQLDLSKTITCGAGRMYILDAGFPVPPSKIIAPPRSVDQLLSVVEALQPGNIPGNLTTYAELALADPTIKAMFSEPDLTITIFAPSNSAWSDYLASRGTTLASFKGSKQAQDLLLGCMAVQRPYMISQFPVSLTQVTDSLNRTFQLAGTGGTPSDNNPYAKLVTDSGSLSVLPAPARNLRGGKSIIHGIDGVLIPNTFPNHPTGVAPADSSSESSSKTNVGLIVGVVVGGCAAVALVALAAIYIVKRRTVSMETWTIHTGSDTNFKGVASTPGPHMDLPGVHRGIFTRMVAHEFQWTDYKPVPGDTMSVEAGITDTQLDQMLVRGEDGEGEGECPVVRLSREEVKEQLLLLKNGIIGKGATAMVFQCLWPSRFGPNALLAAKVLREGSDADPNHLQSFAYEASVLSSLLHPNVVRLYGYCLEPPTMVLILELLPTSLKQMLYDAEPCATLVSTASITDQQKSRGVTLPSTRLPSDAAHSSTHDSSVYGSSEQQQQQQTGGYSPTSAPSKESLSGPQAQSPLPNSKPFRSSSAVVSDSEVTVTMQPAKAAVRKLTVREVLTISADIAAGLAFMHDRAGVEVLPASQIEESVVDRTAITKVVHRDLKPANILMNSRGRAKISDFGLAREHHQTTIATAHLGAGTLPYMAPELLVYAAAGPYAHASATNRVDIYSLAMIIWEQLAGQPPWKDAADAALVFGVTQGRRPPLPEPPTEEPQLHPDLLDQPASLEVLPQLNAVVRACWRQRELKRPTATVVLHALNSLLTKLGSPPTDMATSPDHVALNLYSALSGAPSTTLDPSNSFGIKQ